MKKNALILLGCWMLIFNFQTSAQAKSLNLGLISDLMQIKCESELNLAQVDTPFRFDSGTAKVYDSLYACQRDDFATGSRYDCRQ